MEAPPSHLISCVSVSAAQWQCCYRPDQEGQQTIRGWGGYKYTRTMGLSMGGQSDHNTIRIPALCHKLFRTQKNKIIKLEGKTFCTIYFRLGPAIATVKCKSARPSFPSEVVVVGPGTAADMRFTLVSPAAEMARPGPVS